MTAENTVFALKQHWQEFCIPSYAQFDNATVFTGFHGSVDSVGQVVHCGLLWFVVVCCLGLYRCVKPIFK
ncbi:MAG: hypothetical protein LBJ67_18550 [Planctomycetaceae bacterium]|jgi:hypothetical protein|nr:hypothetical protein [Planctomycetaceae bacterium]